MSFTKKGLRIHNASQTGVENASLGVRLDPRRAGCVHEQGQQTYWVRGTVGKEHLVRWTKDGADTFRVAVGNMQKGKRPHYFVRAHA